MNSASKQKRNRLIALSFASVLLLLVYGPLAQWFVAADRFLYDRLASQLSQAELGRAVIVTIDSSRTGGEDELDLYGEVIDRLNQADVARITMANPPEIAAADDLPAWVQSLSSGAPVYVPSRHRFAEFTAKRCRDGT